jgi:Asp-tRNA(Asn)/Glu-tRNA(Gln) amidotransferase A subunit family amidase
MTTPNQLSAVAAVHKIALGALTSEALVTACVERIEAREAEVKAFAHFDRQQALAQARAADEAARQGRGLGPLHGVPVAIKDIIDTADMPTENGSPVFAGRRPERDAACVASLRKAGAIIIGKTISTELATLTPNITHNPRNLAHTPGGSSSGSAAAVADDMVPLALGTQTGGSVIRPGSFCGVFAFKPSFGLIPRTGLLDQSKTLDTVGVFARSVEDLALIADVLAAYDPRDSGSSSVSHASLLEQAMQPWKLKPMFAFVKTSAWDDFADPVTKEAFGELVEMLGQQVEEIDLTQTTQAGITAQRVVNDFELARQFGPLLDKQPDLISKRLAGQIADGRAITPAAYQDALAVREVAYAACQELFLNYGTILTPAATGPAPKGLGSTGNSVFNAFWSLVGTPAVTLPLLEADGLPIGVQLVGARMDDGRLLRSARLLVEQLAAD